MAAINFPAASESPWYNPENGITYEYIGGTWRSVNQLSGAFDDTYVEVAGDTMTGNLTLGDGTTDQIELKAGDGSATFAGDVTIYGTTDLIFKTSPTSGVDPTTYSRSGINHNASLGSGDQKTLYTIQTRNTSASIPGPTLSFKSDINSHSGGELQVDIHNGDDSLNADFIYRATGFDGYNKDGDQTFSINPQDGSASFAGGLAQITSDGYLLTERNNVNGTLPAFKVVGKVGGAQQGRLDFACNGELKINDNNNDEKVTIRPDGSATFTKNIIANDYISGGSNTTGQNYGIIGTINQSKSGSAAAVKGQNINNGGRVWAGQNSAGTVTSEIFADGSASFVGQVYVGESSLNSTAINVTNISSNTTLNVRNYSANTNSRVYEARNSGNTVVWWVNLAGNSGFRNVILETERDNPANYTTTMVDGEEQKVYNGPTLDVKERLTKADTALQNLKTAVANAVDFAELKAAMTTALADI